MQIEPLEPRQLLTAYFVSPTGNDNARGSKSHPWQSIARLNRNDFKHGDLIEFDGAKHAVYPGTLILGTAAAKVSVTSYDGTATIEAAAGDGIDVTAAGVSISNLIVTSPDQLLNDGTGILFNNATGAVLHGATVSNVTVTNFGFSGLGVEAFNTSSPAGFSNVSITDSQFDDNGVAGIDVGNWQWGLGDQVAFQQEAGVTGTNITIENCSTNYNTGLNAVYQSTYPGHSLGAGIVVHNVDGCVIDHCVAHDNFKAADGTPDQTGDVAIWAHDANNVTIEHSEAYDNATTATDGGGFDLDRGTTNSVLQYDFSHDNAVQGYGFLLAEVYAPRAGYENANDTIRFCISQNDGVVGGIAVFSLDGSQDPVLNGQIYNNTIYTDDGNPAVHIQGGADPGGTQNMAVRDNIFYMSAGGPAVSVDSYAIADYVTEDGIQFQANDYFYPTGTFQVLWHNAAVDFNTWTTTVGQETYGGAVVGTQIDPQLTNAGGATTETDRSAMNAYRLQPDSPAATAGLNPADFSIDPGDSDFYERSLAATPIGASAAVPSPWTAGDIGTGFTGTGYFGSGSTTGNGNWTDVGSGLGLSTAADQFSFVSEPVSASRFSLTIDLTSLQSADVEPPNKAAFSGLMIRQNPADPASPFAAIGFTPAGSLKWSVRTIESVVSKTATIPVDSRSGYLRFVRSGSGTSVAAFFSRNGKRWSIVGRTKLPGLTGETEMGFASSSGDDHRQVVTTLVIEP